MIWILIGILGVLLYIASILRTIAGNQVQQAIHNKAQRRELLDAIRKK